MIFNALTRVTIKSLKKKVYYFFKKNVIVTRWKMGNCILILLKMYWATFSNTSGSVLEIVTNKNGATFP